MSVWYTNVIPCNKAGHQTKAAFNQLFLHSPLNFDISQIYFDTNVVAHYQNPNVDKIKPSVLQLIVCSKVKSSALAS